MAQPKALLTLCFFFLSNLLLTTAQPWRYRSLRRSHSHQSRHEIPSGRIEAIVVGREPASNKLMAEYELKLALRDAIFDLFDNNDSVLRSLEFGNDFTSRDPQRRQTNNEQLSERLTELDKALQSLMQLLAQDYSVVVTTSSSTTDASSPTLTPEPLSKPATAGASPTSSFKPTNSTAAHTSFNPMSTSNTVVYYSQSDKTSEVPLTKLCNDPNIDIIVLAFVSTLFSSPDHTGWPTLNMGSRCWAASSAQTAAGASQLIDCVSDGFAAQISQCQGMGKKVMLSIGGAAGYSDFTLPSDEKAYEAAGTIWDLFLGGGSRNGRNNATAESIRPFGEVVLDGIDIDNESGKSLYIQAFMSSLRSFFLVDPVRTYYLSAAPQCPRPDAGTPLPAMQTLTDFVFVQFYNNPSCNLDANASFFDSLTGWSHDLDIAALGAEGEDQQFGEIDLGGFQSTNNGVGSPRLFIGAPAFAAAGSGFVEGAEFRSILEVVKGLELPNLGGVMWWDGAYEEESEGVDGVGESYARIVKEVFV